MTTKTTALSTFLQKAASLLQSNCLKVLSKLGDECIAKILDRSGSESWYDQTGNLRSSIGFAVYEKGVVFMQSSFSAVLQGTDGSEVGKKMITDLAKEYAKVYALVILAGMDYASDVEAKDSRDVLESTRIWAESVIEKRLKTAIDDAINTINSWTI